MPTRTSTRWAGVLLIGCGVGCYLFGGRWLIWGLIPVPWTIYLALPMGILIILFPDVFEDHGEQ